MYYPKSILIALSLIIIGAVACLKDDKDCTPISSTEEKNLMQSFLQSDSMQQVITTNEYEVQYDDRGFYYIIINPGNDQKPSATSQVSVEYKGMLTDASIFDKSTNVVTFQLQSLITGWQLGLPKIGKGGRIMLILPPSLGYGCASILTIPSNSVLIFDISLHTFQ